MQCPKCKSELGTRCLDTTADVDVLLRIYVCDGCDIQFETSETWNECPDCEDCWHPKDKCDLVASDSQK